MVRLRKYFLIAAALQLIWGLVPSASQIVIEQIPVELYIATRWSISGAIFLTYLFVASKWTSLPVRSFIGVASLGILGYGIASLGTLYGLRLGGVTNFALMAALNPMISSLSAIWFLKERPRPNFYLALPLASVGLLLLVLAKYQASTFQVALFSALLILSSYFLESLVFVFSKRFGGQMPLSQYLAISQLATGFFFWILQAAFFEQTGQFSRMSISGVGSLLFVSVVACVLCYFILYWLLQHVEGHRLALFDGLHTLSGAIFGVLIFSETVKPLMVAGGLLLLVAIFVGQQNRSVASDCKFFFIKLLGMARH